MKNVCLATALHFDRSRFVRLLCLVTSSLITTAVFAQQAAKPPESANAAAKEEKAIELDKFVVEGSLLGRARAQDIQKQATNLVNVVSSDSMGTFPDINAAEALARLPGINIVRSDGEGRFVTIRGAKPNFNGVLMNGFTQPSGDRSERRVDLQTVPNALIERIEVTKAATPDISAEGIGGVTNILFRNPADIKGRDVTVSVDYGIQEYDGSDFNASFSYADFLGTEKNLAFVLSANYREAPRETYSIQSSGWGQTPQGVWRPANYTLAWDSLTRERRGVDLAVGYRISPKTKVEARVFYSFFGEPEYQHRLVATAMNPVLGANGQPVEFSAAGGQVTSTFNRNFYFQYWNQDLEGITFKGEHAFSNTMKLDAGISWQTNRESYPFDRGYLAAATPVTGGVFRLNVLDEYVTLAPTNSAAAAAYGGGFSRINTFDNTSSRQDREKENAIYANLKEKFSFSGSSFLEVKGGMYFRLRNKDIDRQSSTLTQIPTSNLTFLDLREGTNTDYAGLGILFGDYGNQAHIWDLLNFNPASFTAVQGELLGFGVGDYVASEDVYAYYLQGTYRLGNLTVIGGARYELTDQYLYRLDNERHVVSFKDDYDHLMPSVHLRYDFTPDLVARASWNNTVGRHDTGDLIYGPVTINRQTSTIVTPNPGLKPLESENIDVSVDWYSGPLGLISFGYFTKDIKNFPLQTAEQVIFEGQPYTELTVQAGVTGKISGWEATFNRRFDFLPAPFNGLGVDLNYADITSEIGTRTRPDKPPIDQQPEWVFNASIYYAYKKFFTRVALSSKSDMINRNGTNATNPDLDNYIAEYSQWDWTFSYDVSRSFQIYGGWRNITSEPETYFIGHKSRPSESKFNGYTYHLGLRWHL